MAVVQPRNAEAFIKRPDPQFSVILVYGPDTGLVSERARALVATSASTMDDPFQLVRLDGALITDDPSRLLDEANTVPLFGERRTIWIKAGSRSIVAPVGLLLDAPPNCRIIIEGGDWKRSHPLVSLVEKSRAGAVVACYPDEAGSINQLISDETAHAGLSIAPEAREALLSLLGGDRLASRNEVQKLCLYAHRSGRIELGDVEAVVGDATNLALDEIVDATFSGTLRGLDLALGKAWREGLHPSVLAGAVLRHALFLHRLRGEVDKGHPAATIVEGAGREVHFRRKAAIAAQLSSLESRRLIRIAEVLAEVILETRRMPQLAEALVSRTLLRVALLTQAKNRRSA